MPPRRRAPRPLVLALHEICHALRRHGAERLICSPSDPGASSRPAAIAAALLLEPGPFSYPAPGPIPVLVPLVQEARRARVQRLAADPAIAIAALEDGDLRVVRASPVPSGLAQGLYGTWHPLLRALDALGLPDRRLLAPGPLEARSAHGRAAAEALRAALPTTARAMLDDLVRTRPQAPRSGTARLVWRSLGPFRLILEDGLPMPRALMEIRP